MTKLHFFNPTYHFARNYQTAMGIAQTHAGPEFAAPYGVAPAIVFRAAIGRGTTRDVRALHEATKKLLTAARDHSIFTNSLPQLIAETQKTSLQPETQEDLL